MLKNKFRFTLKLFIIVWIVLFIHVVLKLSFNYWQPYVIPTEQLENIGNFIDNYRWIQIILNGIFYTINGLLVVLCGLQTWWFKTKRQFILIIILIILNFIITVLIPKITIGTFIICIGIPLVIDKKKWLFIILSVFLSNIFLGLSLWLEGFVNANQMHYIIRMFLQLDYYIMLALNYFVFNLFKKERA